MSNPFSYVLSVRKLKNILQVAPIKDHTRRSHYNGYKIKITDFYFSKNSS